MRVKIVKKKEPKDEVVEMTIEELAECQFIGIKAPQGRFLLCNVGSGYSFVNPGVRECRGYLGGTPTTVERKLQYINSWCFIHVFDNEKEPKKALYLWMAGGTDD